MVKKNTYSFLLNRDFFLNIIAIIAGMMMIGNFLPNVIKVLLIGAQFLCAVMLLYLSFEKINKYLAASWVITVMYIYLNVRTFNFRTVLYCVELLTGCLIVFCGNDAYKSMYHSMKMIVLGGVFAGLTSVLQLIIPGFFMQVIKILSGSTYTDLATNMVNGRYLGLTDYVWYTVLLLLIGGGYLISCFNGKLADNKHKVLMLLILYLAVLLAGSRSSMILFPVLVVLFYGGKHRGIIVCGMLIVGGLMYYYLTHTNFTSGTNFVRLFYKMQQLIEQISSGEEIDEMRASLKVRAVSDFVAHPIFGIGWFEFSNQSVYIYGNDRFLHAHNLYLQLLAENGIIGTLIIVFAPFMIFVKNIWTVSRLKATKLKDTSEYHIAKFCLLVLTYFYIASWLHVTIYDGQTMVIFNMICAMSLGVSDRMSSIGTVRNERMLNAIWVRKRKRV